jgi:hypothetical protein
MKSSRKLLCAVAAVVCLAGNPTRADYVVFDSVTGGDDGYSDWITGGAYFVSIAQSFTMGSSSLALANVVVRMDSPYYPDLPAVPGTFNVSIYGNSGGQPGSLVASLTGDLDPNPSGFANYTYTPSGSVTLSANQIYWVVAQGGTSDDSHRWALNVGGSVPTTGSAGLNYVSYSTQSLPAWHSAWESPYMMEMLVTAVPEPSAMALSLFGGLGILVLNRRLRRKE